jgi:hypothetical protein
MKSRPFHFLSLLLTCLHALAGQSQGQQLRHLFLDPAFVQQSEKVALHVNPPQQREIVIRADKPWEQLMISFYLTVLDEGGKLRMWYICRDKKNQPNVAYAESADGVNWIKPNLGIVEYEGSKDNNLVGLSSLEGTVFRDERAPAEKRYNYITHLWEKDGGMVRFHSPDGLRWSRDAAPLVKFGADSQAVTFWDERAGKYALYLRGWEQRADKKRYRTVVRADLPDLTTPLSIGPTEKSRYMWGKDKPAVIDDDFPKVLATDEADPPNSDVYTISAQPYPVDPRWYVGFPSFFQREKSTSDGRLDVQFIGSRDGFHWHRYDRAPYARPGIAGSESANMVFIGPWLIMRGEEIWQYGTGLQSRHGDKEARVRKTDGVIYRYVQRVDGFVSLDFDAEGGRCVTAPVKVDGPRLALNLDTAVLGHLRAGLLDAEGKPIAGFGPEDCEILQTNSTHALVTWRGKGVLSALQGREVRLRFTGGRAKLFSFYFTADAP